MIIFFCRKISPSANRVASELLSNEANMINSKKLLVSAQITAMISLLESISNIASAIILFLIIRSTFFTMLLSMIVYLVILPNAFLMNTSDNKHRVVEVGWKNIFLNVIHSEYFCSTCCSMSSGESMHQSESDSKNNPKSNIGINTICKTTTKGGMNIIRENQHSTKIMKKDPSCSTTKTIKTQNLLLDKMDVLDAMKISKAYSNHELFQELVTNMQQVLNDEDLYIDYFRQFVNIVEGNYNEYNSDNDFGDHSGRANKNVFQKRHIKAKNFKTIPTKEGRKSEKFDVGSIRSEECSMNSSSEKLSFKGQKASRTIIRKKVLGMLKNSEVEAEAFRLWTEKLINVEESFIK